MSDAKTAENAVHSNLLIPRKSHTGVLYQVSGGTCKMEYTLDRHAALWGGRGGGIEGDKCHATLVFSQSIS